MKGGGWKAQPNFQNGGAKVGRGSKGKAMMALADSSGKKKAAPNGLAMKEEKFAVAVNSLVDKLGNLSTAPSKLSNAWTELLVLRGQLIEASKRPTEPNTPPPSRAAQGMPAAPAPDLSWKSQLRELCTKCIGREPTKEDLSYFTGENPGGGFVGRVLCGELSGRMEYQGEVAASKKLAEQLAAQAALMELFPEEYAAITGTVARSHTGYARNGGAGVKRKAEPIPHDVAPIAQTPTNDTKGRLVYAASLLMGGRNVSKGDIVYDIQEIDGDGTNKFVATVTIVAYDNESHMGSAAPSKKAAEASAAQIALDALGPRLAPMEEEYKAKKRKLNQEKLAALKERTLEKKAQVKAEAE